MSSLDEQTLTSEVRSAQRAADIVERAARIPNRNEQPNPAVHKVDNNLWARKPLREYVGSSSKNPAAETAEIEEEAVDAVDRLHEFDGRTGRRPKGAGAGPRGVVIQAGS